MGDPIFYNGKKVADYNTRHIKSGLKSGYQTIYIFEGLKSLKKILNAPDIDYVQYGGWEPESEIGKESIPVFMEKLGNSLAVYFSLEAQLANENR
ncbi:MAG: hypothetical protein KAT28_02205 [Candidatus Aenigmarchaeota archaeon]|nr:hypothetical protein [Candidatus Aenigmarchaeota archaeon]